MSQRQHRPSCHRQQPLCDGIDLCLMVDPRQSWQFARLKREREVDECQSKLNEKQDAIERSSTEPGRFEWHPARAESAIFTLLGTSSVWLGWLLQGSRYDLWWQIQVLSQIVDALIGEVPVKVVPRESLGNVASRCQRLQGLDDMQIWDSDLGVIDDVKVLFGDHDTLGEKVLVNGSAVLLWHQHFAIV